MGIYSFSHSNEGETPGITVFVCRKMRLDEMFSSFSKTAPLDLIVCEVFLYAL